MDKPAYGILINGEGEVEEMITLPYFRYAYLNPMLTDSLVRKLN